VSGPPHVHRWYRWGRRSPCHDPGVVLHLRLSAPTDDADRLARAIERTEGVRRMLVVEAGELGRVLVSADVEAGAADGLIAELEAARIDPDDYLLSRLEVVAPTPSGRTRIGRTSSFAWIEILGEARANSRPFARYLALMMVSGAIAALGVLTSNTILIVGAMAVSPDLLPICATCVALVGRKGSLARRSFATLIIGLTLVVAVAMLLAFLLDVLGFLADDYKVGEGGLGSLVHTDYSTVLVALAAGVAAILAFETRASAAVGVAISVTTIPASAYLGVAIGVGEGARGLDGLEVLSINVVLLIVAGSLTLAIQRVAAARAERRAAPSPQT
jgi:uncharacterized hydrophobic protein (TIGR00271 family)